MAKKVTVYTTNTCAYCVMVKKWLKMKGFAYEEVNLDEQPERAEELVKLSGQMAVPVVVIAEADAADSQDQTIVVGYNPVKLNAALGMETPVAA